MTFHVPAKYRVTKPEPGVQLERFTATGNNGAFRFVLKTRVTRQSGIAIPGMPAAKVMVPIDSRSAVWCIASDGTDWERAWPGTTPFEHVSVSIVDEHRCPSWDEMCAVKNTFWDPDDCVIQFHPPKSDYVNYNWKVLHLWRPIGVELPRPPAETVGPVAAGVGS